MSTPPTLVWKYGTLYFLLNDGLLGRL